MGACGCAGCGQSWKLPGPNGTFYEVASMIPCLYCGVGPSLRITHIVPGSEASKYREDFHELDELPLDPAEYNNELWGGPTAAFDTGMSKEDFVEELVKGLEDAEMCCQIAVDVAGDESWEDVVKAPALIDMSSPSEEPTDDE